MSWNGKITESYHQIRTESNVKLMNKFNNPNFWCQNLLHCAWSPDGAMVAAGSADRFVYIWDTTSRRIMYKLPGHLGSVNDVDFHKLEPIGIVQ